ncbi:acyl-[acyl-carrier-protein] thioesterase [Akkermansia glycaniphila]|nr:acyl-ACP thioesterase domain-containing protein [Akkermansia glycaniphila]OCA02196.1 hypothetical protein AC781_11600 [Akkermansia glycaniphila]
MKRLMDTWQSSANVCSYECDASGLMRPESLLHWIQDAAETHAAALGFGYDWGMAQGLAWVETAVNLRVLRWPAWKESTAFRTWTGIASPVQARRRFELFDSAGNLLAEADYLWVLIDTERRRPVPLKRMGELLPKTECPACVPPPPVWEPGLNNGDLQRTFRVTGRDIDFNGHVNNASYLVWALDDLGERQYSAGRLREIHMAFRKETLLNEEISISCGIVPGRTRHLVTAGGQRRAEIDLVWQSRGFGTKKKGEAPECTP